jgi:hypothetical protein
MPYLNDDVYTASDLGLHESDLSGVFDKIKSVFKTSSDIYQLQKQQRAAGKAAVVPTAPVPQKSFFQKHGTKIMIGGVALVALIVVLRKKKKG